MDNNIDKFIKDQLSVWPLAAENYRDLKKVETKRLDVGGLEVIVQHNPCRKISSEGGPWTLSLSARGLASSALRTARRSRPTLSSRGARDGNTASR